MRDGLGDSSLGPGGDGAVPPWPAPGPREPGEAPHEVIPPHRPVPGAGRPGHASRRRGPRRSGGGQWLRYLFLVGLAAGIAGLVMSVIGVTFQLMPRSFSAAQRRQIMAWEVAKRWRSWPAGQIFPEAISYALPGKAFGGGRSLPLTAQRVGIAPQASCQAAALRAAGGVLAQHGCLAVLRATYADTTQTLAVTVGVAVLPAASAAREAAKALGSPGDPRSGVKAVSFRRTVTARFGDKSQKLWWDRAAGPYLVLATVGYADGRPWIARGGDTYTQAELVGLASGAGQRVAAGLGAAPPPPHCPGNPAC